MLSGRKRRELASKPEATAPVSGGGIADPGVIHNALVQIVSQLATLAFTAGLTLYLVRALGASRYGIYSLAFSIGGLLLFPAGLGLPLAVGRYVADHKENISHMRGILRLGLKLQVPAALVASIALFAVSGPVAHAYGHPQLTWPLRWMSVVVLGQALFTFVGSMSMSVRRLSAGFWMNLIESATETTTAIALVLAGAGAAGAMLGKAIGYAAGAAAGLYLVLRLFGGARARGVLPTQLTVRRLASYAGVMFVVDVGWSAITQVDVLLIGALLTSAAVGGFSAVLRILVVLGYLGTAVSDAVSPRLSFGGGGPDTRAFGESLRFLIIVQGLVIAPMLVWSGPIVHLLLGSGYPSSAGIMRALTPYYFISAPGALLSVSVTYLGEGRRRVFIVLGSLGFGLVVTYVLLKAVGVVGAALGDDLVEILYVSAHLWLCSRLIRFDLKRVAWSGLRTLLAAGAMALPLLAIGTDHLSAADWLAGACAGGVAYMATLLITRELSVAELRLAWASLWFRLRPMSS